MNRSPTDTVKWEERVTAWANEHRRVPRDPAVVALLVDFFERSFLHARHPDRSWFGLHDQAASLVVGGIYLAAVRLSQPDFGVWLMVDENAPALTGVEIHPVKASRGFDDKLQWVHAPSLVSLGAIVESDATWRSYEDATDRIIHCPHGKERDATQRRRGKARLVEIADAWQLTPRRSYGDESQGIARTEGARVTVTTERCERDPRLRKDCLRIHGLRCGVCGLVLADRYGPAAVGIIHVHHLVALSASDGPREVDPERDLIPVCPNCHAVIHSRVPAYPLGEVRAMLGLF